MTGRLAVGCITEAVMVLYLLNYNCCPLEKSGRGAKPNLRMETSPAINTSH